MPQSLTVKQLLEALTQCEYPDSFVKFHDFDTEKTFSLVFVEECITSTAPTNSVVLLHRFEPELDKVTSEPIKSVSRRTSTFARTEWEDCNHDSKPV